MAAAVIEALAQWDVLAQRELAEDYQIKEPPPNPQAAADSSPSSSSSGLHQLPATRCCPSAWREKIVEWCYQVVDHW